MSFATYSFQELGYVGHTTVTAWTVFHYTAVCFFTSALQITVHDSKKKKNPKHMLTTSTSLMLFSSFLTQKKKKKIISIFFSAGVPNRLSTNCQFPYSQRSQFPPSSKIMKSRGKNDLTSTYPFHKHTVRNLPCVRY